MSKRLEYTDKEFIIQRNRVVWFLIIISLILIGVSGYDKSNQTYSINGKVVHQFSSREESVKTDNAQFTNEEVISNTTENEPTKESGGNNEVGLVSTQQTVTPSQESIKANTSSEDSNIGLDEKGVNELETVSRDISYPDSPEERKQVIGQELSRLGESEHDIKVWMCILDAESRGTGYAEDTRNGYAYGPLQLMPLTVLDYQTRFGVCESVNDNWHEYIKCAVDIKNNANNGFEQWEGYSNSCIGL